MNANPSLIRSAYKNRHSPYIFLPGTWCANLVVQDKIIDPQKSSTSRHFTVCLALPEQPDLERGTVYKTLSFPVSLVPPSHADYNVECVYVFCVNSDAELAPYHRTGWEFTGIIPVLLGVSTLGFSAIVTLPVSAYLACTHRGTEEVTSNQVLWYDKESPPTYAQAPEPWMPVPPAYQPGPATPLNQAWPMHPPSYTAGGYTSV